MSQWLDSSNNSNKFKQSYFRNFVDVSGEVLIRNGQSLKLYNNSVPTRTQFSINSDEFRIFNENDQTYYDISNTNLIHIKDLTSNVQTQLNTFNEKTIHFATDVTNSDTMVELDALNNSVVIHSTLDVSYDIIGKSDLSINRNIHIGGDASFNGRVDICGNFYAQYPENSIPASAIIGGEGGSIDPNSDVSLNQHFSLGGDASFNGQVDVCGNFYANYPNDSIPLSAVSTLLTNLNDKANIESPNFTGIPTAITANTSTNTTQLATTAFVQTRISEIIGAAPETLDTLNELASALGDDANFSTTIMTLIGDNSNNLATEIIRATTAESGLTTLINDVSDNLATEVSRATTAEGSLTTLVSDVSDNLAIEVTRATTAEGVLATHVGDVSDNLAIEVTRATAAEGVLTTLVGDISDNLNASIALTAPILSPNFIGTPTAPTTISSNNTTQIATTAFVQSRISEIIGSAPESLDTLNKLAAALGDDANFSTNVTNTLASKAPLANPTFTGILNADNMNITNDASFNSRVDICGNFYAQYPDSTIPASAIIGGVGGVGGGDAIDISSNQTISGIKTFENGLVIGQAQFNVINQTSTENITTDSSAVTINPTSTWVQSGGDFDGIAANNRTGARVALNSEGNIIAVASVAISGFGYVKVYVRNANKTSADSYGPIGWNQIGQTITSTLATGAFGEGITLNSDGYVLALGHALSANNNGLTYVYSYNTTTNEWIQRGDTIVGEAANNYSGRAISLSADGTIIAIDAYGNSDGAAYRGHVRVYKYDANKTVANTNQSSSTFGPIGWNRLGQDIDGESAGDWSGFYTSLSSDGTIVAIGAYAANNSRGQVRVYKYDINKTTANTDQSSATYGPVGWNRLGQDIDGDPSTANYAGVVSLNSDGTIVAIGGYISNSNTGHVRVYKYDVNKTVADTNQSSPTYGPVGWNRLGQDLRGSAVNNYFGETVSLNSVGNILAVGVPGVNLVRVYLYDINKTTEDLNTSSSTFGPVGWNRIGQDLTGPSSSRTGAWTRLNSVGNIVAIGAPNFNSATGKAFVYSIPTTSTSSTPSSSVTTIISSSIEINYAVDICGNFYAQYPDSSIPASAIIGIDNNISTATQSALDLKSDINSPTFTGIPAAPTAGAGTNTTQLATTAFVSTAVSSKANLASPALTGTPTAPTAGTGTNNTQLATTAFVSTAITNLVSGAPGALDTLNELAAALGDDANFSTTVTNTLASKAPLANPTFTGQVDICGNLYAQYPDSSIPASAIIGGVGGVSDNLSISNLNVSGNVGIGTSNPEKPLHVIGDSKIGSLNLTTITSQSGIVYDASWVQVGNTVEGVAMTEDPQAPYIGSTTSLNADGTIMAHGSNTGYVNVYKYRYITQAEWDTSPSDDRNISVVKYQDTVFDPNKQYWIQMGNSIRDTIGSADRYSSVALNETGNIIVIAGINDDTYATNAGIGKVFTYNSNTDSWTKLGQDVYGVTNEYLGTCLDINADGTIVAYGTYYAYSYQGKIQVFQYNSGTNQWVQLGQTFTGGQFGVTLSLSSDGYTLACGTAAYMNALVYKYSLDTQTFQQVGGSIPYEVNGDQNGSAVSLTQDGSIVAVGSQWSDSTNATAYLNRAGQVRVFEYRLVTADEWAETATPNRSGVVIKNGDATLNVTTKYWVQLGNDILGINPDHRFGSQVFIRKTTEHGIILAAGEAARVYTFQYRSITEDEWNTPTINDNNMGVIKGNDTVYNSEKSYWIQIGGDIVRPSDAVGAFGSNKFGFNSSGTTIVTSAPNSYNAFGRVFVYNLPYRALNFQNDSVIDTFDNNSRRNLVLNNTLSIDASNNTTFTGRVDICGNLYAQYPNSSIPPSAIIGGVGVDANSDVSFNQNLSIGGDASFNQNLSIGGDVSFNQNLSIGGDASFNGRVDICGNFYAQYPDNSIPESAILRDAASGGNTVSDPVEFIDDFAIITGAGQEVTLDANNFALIKPLPYGQIGSHDITFENNFAIIQDGVEPYIHPRLSVTKYLSVSNLASFTGIVTFDNIVYVNTPNLYDSSQLVATTAYVKGQNYATASTLFRQF